MFFNSKGQAFEAYHLLIAFIVSVAILGIIFTMINKTNSNAVIISTQKIDDAFLSAINSPIVSMEKPFLVENVLISGIISLEKYKKLGKIEDGCFSFIVGPGVTIEKYGAKINKKYLKTNVYFSCGLKDMESNLISKDIWPGFSPNQPFDKNPADNCERLFCVMYINATPYVLKK